MQGRELKMEPYLASGVHWSWTNDGVRWATRWPNRESARENIISVSWALSPPDMFCVGPDATTDAY